MWTISLQRPREPVQHFFGDSFDEALESAVDAWWADESSHPAGTVTGMSYSFTIPSVTAANPADLERAVADQISNLSDGPGRDEATAAEAVILDVLPRLAAILDADKYALSVSGSRSGDTQVSLNFSVLKLTATPPTAADAASHSASSTPASPTQTTSSQPPPAG